MSNKKATKRALLTSILAICLCLVMLIGSTFAWFTDTASTGVNKIVAGNLDVDIIGANDENHVEKLNFTKAASAGNEQLLWEPGCRYLTEGFRIANKGNLALKWKAQVNMDSIVNGKVVNTAKDGVSLLDVIDFYLVTSKDVNDMGTALDEFSGNLTAKTNSDVYYIKGVMQTTAGNDYQNLTLEGITITVLATQDTVEADSFTDQYDADAQYPVAASGSVTLGEGNTVEKEVTIVSAKKTEDGEQHVAKAVVPAGAVAETPDVKQMTLSVTNAAKPATLTVESSQSSNTLEVKMIGLSENNTTPITVSLFVGKGLEGFQLYHHNTAMTQKGSVAEIGDQEYYYDSATGIVTFKTKTFSPFTCVYNKGNWSGSTGDGYSTPVDTENKVVTIANAEELALFAKQVNGGTSYAGYTVKLVNDIDLGANMWTPIGNKNKTFMGIFDGQGYTISNLVCSEAARCDVGLFGFTKDGEIKNFTLHNAEVKGYLNVGAVAGTPYTSKYSNIKLTGNVQVDGYAYVGGMFGKNAYANLTDLTIDVDAGSYVKADSGGYRTYIGGLVGFMGEGSHVVKNVTSNINVIGSTCDVGGITGIAHYGNTFINCTSSGNVTLTNAPDEGDQLEIGGIAGVWHNETGCTVTFTNCKFTGVLSTSLNGMDKTADLDDWYKITGRKYGDGTGTLIIDGQTVDNH